MNMQALDKCNGALGCNFPMSKWNLPPSRNILNSPKVVHSVPRDPDLFVQRIPPHRHAALASQARLHQGETLLVHCMGGKDKGARSEEQALPLPFA